MSNRSLSQLHDETEDASPTTVKLIPKKEFSGVPESGEKSTRKDGNGIDSMVIKTSQPLDQR